MARSIAARSARHTRVLTTPEYLSTTSSVAGLVVGTPARKKGRGSMRGGYPSGALPLLRLGAGARPQRFLRFLHGGLARVASRVDRLFDGEVRVQVVGDLVGDRRTDRAQPLAEPLFETRAD